MATRIGTNRNGRRVGLKPGGAPHADRGAIDGRVCFGCGALALVVGLAMLLERIGAPAGLVRLIVPTAGVAALAIIGMRLATMRLAAFYAADRGVPPAYAALASTGLVAGLFAAWSAHAPALLDSSDLAVGMALGLVAVAVFTGPTLREAGATSLAQGLAARFPAVWLRWLIAILVAGVTLALCMACIPVATDRLAALAGFSRPLAATLVVAATLAIALPGGIAGVVWAGAAAGIVLATSLLLPLGLALWGGGFPLVSAPQGGAFAPLRSGLGPDLWQHAAVIASVAIAVAVLPPLVQPAMTTSAGRAVRRAGLALLGWSIALGTAAFLLAGAQTSAAPGFSLALASLSGAGPLAAVLVGAAASAHACAAALGNDATRLGMGATVLASRRLAIARLLTIAAGVSSAVFDVDPSPLLSIGLAAAAALVAPLLVLARWRRADTRDAIVALVVGVVTLDGAGATAQGAVPDALLRWAGLGFVLATGAGLLTSFLHQPTSRDGDGRAGG